MPDCYQSKTLHEDLPQTEKLTRLHLARKVELEAVDGRQSVYSWSLLWDWTFRWQVRLLALMFRGLAQASCTACPACKVLLSMLATLRASL